jgi:hypothetical protein
MTLRKLSCRSLLWLALASSANAAEIVTPDGGHYTGPLVDGLRHGQGQVVWDNGARYRGGFEDGLYSGQGRLEMPGGRVYEGGFHKGVMAGQGRLAMADGTVYVGEFRDGDIHGQGRMELPGVYHYEGGFEKGQMHGRGRLGNQNGEYEGDFRQGMYWGRGSVRYKDGRKYSGDFERNLFHGKGHYETPAGEVYEGDFVKGEFTGTGLYTHRRGMRHEGGFEKWRAKGQGKLVEMDGTIYEGEFGPRGLTQGVMRTKDGAHYEGPFRSFRPHGKGVLKLANGDVYEGRFAYGLYDGEGTLTYAKPQADGRTRDSGRWRFGRRVDEAAAGKAATDIEAAIYGQRALLDQALAGVTAREPDKINLYLLTVAGDGGQEVFRRETDFVRQQFERDFGTRGHALSLVNSRNTLATAPMASRTSLREGLQRIATVMDKEQDILFLYLASHGSRRHEFLLDQNDIELPDLQAAELGRLLKESGIRWKVVVISACYSGGFIDALKDGHTLVITAARHDRTSFGCSDENDFTYFGRAFFKEALPQSGSFQEAFRRAEKLITQWEDDDAKKAASQPPVPAPSPADLAEEVADEAEIEEAVDEDEAEEDVAEQPADNHSLPQMVGAPAIERHLEGWWRQVKGSRRNAQAAQKR